MQSTIEKLVNELDQEINRVYTDYTKAHEELDKHRGKPLSDTNLDEVNRLLGEIQELFSQLYPAYHFIAHRHQYAVNATSTYNDFIEAIKKAGAQQHEDPSKPKTRTIKP